VQPDPYDVLGLEQDAASAAIKKHFWRVSLLIHPDKCAHARAGEAFDAVKKAAQTLQDSERRGAVDARRASAEEDALNRRFAAELERERQWRVLQGRATADDLKCVWDDILCAALSADLSHTAATGPSSMSSESNAPHPCHEVRRHVLCSVCDYHRPSWNGSTKTAMHSKSCPEQEV
jgi:curved DNA-binding protein CbpA